MVRALALLVIREGRLGEGDVCRPISAKGRISRGRLGRDGDISRGRCRYGVDVGGGAGLRG